MTAALPKAEVNNFDFTACCFSLIKLIKYFRILRMKNIIAIITFTLFTLITAPQAQASSIAQNLCDYVSVDNKSKLRTYLKNNKLKIRRIYADIQCNGKNLLQFASDKNATNTGSMMIGKLPKKVVAQELALITSSELAAIAQKRVNS